MVSCRTVHQSSHVDGLVALGQYRAVAEVDNKTIDEINILQATMKAMREAVANLSSKYAAAGVAPDAVLVDGNRCPWGNPAGTTAKGGERPADPPAPLNRRRCIAVIKGVGQVRAIAAASALAKVHREWLCREHHALYTE